MSNSEIMFILMYIYMNTPSWYDNRNPNIIHDLEDLQLPDLYSLDIGEYWIQKDDRSSYYYTTCFRSKVVMVHPSLKIINIQTEEEYYNVFLGSSKRHRNKLFCSYGTIIYEGNIFNIKELREDNSLLFNISVKYKPQIYKGILFILSIPDFFFEKLSYLNIDVEYFNENQ